MSALMSSTLSNMTSANSQDQQRKFSLVKWLENAQFDASNEFSGRLVSVPHSNIIDFDSEDLKAGMEISVFKNGEIWKAQIIIPRTSSTTVDLPPTMHKKIRTKVMATNKLAESGDEQSDQSAVITLNPSNISASQIGCLDMNNNKTFADLNDFEDVTSLFATPSTSSTIPVNSISSNGSSTINASHIPLDNHHQHHPHHHQTNLLNHMPSNGSTHAICKSTGDTTAAISVSTTNKEWQLLQTAMNEAGLNDLYQTFSSDTPSNETKQAHYTSTNGTPYKYTVSDMNIETILQMQCELLEQQKELKAIETDTLEQLRFLHTNISRLARKFDSFESIASQKYAERTAINFNCNYTDSLNNSYEDASASSKLMNTRRRVNRNGRMHQSKSPSASNNSHQTVYSTSTSLAESIAATVAFSAQNDFSDSSMLTSSGVKLEDMANPNNVGTIKTTVKLTDDILVNTHDHMSSAKSTLDVDLDSSSNEKIKGIQNQLALNRFLRESVKQRLGADYLANHAVSDIPVNIMKQIKKEAFEKYLPNDCRPIKAWCLAMASLRCLKRDLVKHKSKQLAAAALTSSSISHAAATTNAVTDSEEARLRQEADHQHQQERNETGTMDHVDMSFSESTRDSKANQPGVARESANSKSNFKRAVPNSNDTNKRLK